MAKAGKWVGRSGMVLLAAGLLWVQLTPRAVYSAEVERLRVGRQQAWDLAQQNYANDQNQNLFLDPDLHPVWALKTEHPPASPLSKALEEFAHFNTYEPVRNLDQSLARMGKTREQFESARKQFRAVIPKLLSACKRPVFWAPLTPAGKLTGRTVIPNLLGIRRVAHDCAFEASLRIEEGRPESSVELGLLPVRLGGSMLRMPGLLIQALVGSAIQFSGIEVLQQAVSSGKLSTASLQSIFAAAAQEQPPEDALVSALESEVLMVHNSLDDRSILIPHAFGRAGEELRPRTSERVQDWFLRNLGVVAREVRMYDNTMMPLVLEARQGRPLNQPTLDPSEIWVCELKGSGGLLSFLLVPNVSRAAFQFDLLRTRLSALRLMAAIQLYHQQAKKYPEELQALKVVGLEEIPPAPISTSGFQYRLVSGQPELSIALKPELITWVSPAGVESLQEGKLVFWAQSASAGLGSGSGS